MKKLLILVAAFILVLGTIVTNTHADSHGDYFGSEVCIPTIVVLLGLGLLGMAVFAVRKRKRKKRAIKKQMLKF